MAIQSTRLTQEPEYAEVRLLRFLRNRWSCRAKREIRSAKQWRYLNPGNSMRRNRVASRIRPRRCHWSWFGPARKLCPCMRAVQTSTLNEMLESRFLKMKISFFSLLHWKIDTYSIKRIWLPKLVCMLIIVCLYLITEIGVFDVFDYLKDLWEKWDFKKT